MLAVAARLVVAARLLVRLLAPAPARLLVRRMLVLARQLVRCWRAASSKWRS